MGPTPEVSVVVPMRNMERYVQMTLRSALESGLANLEVVVVDDGSTDGSVEQVRAIGDPRIRIVPGPSLGVARSAQAGFDASRGAFLTRCDADDLLPPGRLAQQLAFLKAHPEFGAVCGRLMTIDARGRKIALLCESRDAEITDELRNGLTRTHFGTFLVRREVLRKAGGCRPWFRSAEDIDLQLRIGCATRVYYLASNAYVYRLHENSLTHSTGRHILDWYEEQARRFARQRRDTGSDDLDRCCAPEPPREHNARVGRAADQIQQMLLGSAWREHERGRTWAALLLGCRAIAHRPTIPAVWKSVLALAIKRPTAPEEHARPRSESGSCAPEGGPRPCPRAGSPST